MASLASKDLAATWRNEGHGQVSAPVKLIGFLLLIGAVFIGARAVGAYLGPVTTSQSQTGGGTSMNMGTSGSMNMGGQPAQQARLRGGRP